MTRQLPLFGLAKPLTAFQRETLRRGGPLEVEGKRWGAARRARNAKARQNAPLSPDVLRAIGGGLQRL